MKHNNSRSNRFRLWKFFPALAVLLLLVPAALATDSIYQNKAVRNYSIPDSPPPNIDALAFDNENEFNVSFFQYSPSVAYYETKDTLFYTNNGTMTASASILSTAFSFFFIGNAYGSGYQFDHLTTNVIQRTPADTFYNPGTIRCNSVEDGNNYFIIGNTTYFFLASLGECLVSATNIINPGVVKVGADGLMQFSGQNVDLSHGTLVMEDLQSLFLGSTVGLYATAAGFGVDTNRDWNPGTALRTSTAVSSRPFVITLTNSTAYFDIQGNVSNVIYRSVFVQNTSPGVPYNVYIDPLNVSALFSGGAAHVEWIGTYVDPTTGEAITSHLYLTDDYAWGASTNVLLDLNGMPDNFSFLTSAQPLLFNPTPSGFLPVFSDGIVTNPYSYFNAQLIPTTAPTNVTGANPTGALNKLPSRIEVTATRELNLNQALISGQNYLSLLATNQFDGSGGAQIAAPFSDINLGVTNGFMAVSNLLQSALPAWSGYVQAWSTRWLTTFTNTLDGTNFFIATNDFRVLIVGSSQLKPVSQPQVQNLRLHATNSLVISDVLNVFGSLYIDAQNLTLTTNAFDNGASSAQGELNLENSDILWQTYLPNIRNLTNSGAITTHNQVVFGSPAPTYLTNNAPGTPAVPATATLFGTNMTGSVLATNWVSIGSFKYNFVNTLTNSVPNQVKVAATFDGSLSNLIAAINQSAGSGAAYSALTTSNKLVSAGALSTNHSFLVTARTNGSAGNSIALGSSTLLLNWNGLRTTTLAGGVDNLILLSAPYDSFVSHGVISDLDATVYAKYFEAANIFTNGVGSFLLQSQNAVVTNGSLGGGGDVSITATNLVIGSVVLKAGRSLTLAATDLLTDNGVTNGNVWTVGGGTGNNYLSLPVKPRAGDLLGTTLTLIARTNAVDPNVWAATNLGPSVSGYTNNAAIGHLILDSFGAYGPPSHIGTFDFNGTGVSNALYVDFLELRDAATNRAANGDFSALNIYPNMVIYFARADMNGVSIVDKINHKNSNRLQWVTNYAGYFSSTNFVFPSGVTNGPFNAALAQSTSIDSDGDGVANGNDLVPFFASGMINMTVVNSNNVPPPYITWNTIPNATNFVYYSTNLPFFNLLTNGVVFASPAGSVISATRSNFVVTFSSGTHASPVPVTVTDTNGVSSFYKVRVDIKQ